MSSISKHWGIYVSQWPRAIAELARSMRNMLKVWIRGKDVRIDYFVSDAVYVIEESTCMLSWSVYDAYRVQLSDGLGQYTQLQHSIRVSGNSLPERLILTAFGGNGVVQAELFFSHIRADQKAVPPPVLVSQEPATFKAEVFVPDKPVPTPLLQMSLPEFRLPTVDLAFDNGQITKLMHDIHTTEPLAD